MEDSCVDYIKIFKGICLTALDVHLNHFPRDLEDMSTDQELFLLLKMLIMKLEQRVLEKDSNSELKALQDVNDTHFRVFRNHIESEKTRKRASFPNYWELVGRRFTKTLFPPSFSSNLFPTTSRLKKKDKTGNNIFSANSSKQLSSSFGKQPFDRIISSSFGKKEYVEKSSYENISNVDDWGSFPKRSNADATEFTKTKINREKCIELLRKNPVRQVNKETNVPLRTLFRWKRKMGKPILKKTRKLILKDEDIDKTIRELAGIHKCGLGKAFLAKKELKERLKEPLNRQ